MEMNVRDEEILVQPYAGETVWLRGLGARYLVAGERTEGRLALVEHPLHPRALGAPMHTHSREDEISYVIEGTVGIQIGERVLTAEPGAMVFKSRGIPHAFWNAGDTTARILEVITPAGFEGYFREMAALFEAAKGGLPDPAAAAALYVRYGVEMDFGSIPRLIEAHHLQG
jgi:quercetin dioxygenase-like cupin family protein